MKKIDNRSVLVVLISLFTFVMIAGGVSYAYYVYNKDLATVDLTSGSINISFTKTSNTSSVTAGQPIEDNLGIVNPNYLEFTVTGKTDIEAIKYEIEIIPNNNNILDGQYVKFYLTEYDSTNGTETVLASPVLYTELYNSLANDGKGIYQDLIEGNSDGTSKTTVKVFRLRAWVDKKYKDTDSASFAYSIYLYAENVDATNCRKVNFILNDAEEYGLSKYVEMGSEYGSLPVPYKEGYNFVGWQTMDNVMINSSDIADYLSDENGRYYKGNYTFNGTSDYIDTDFYLFNSENFAKNFIVYLEIKENQSTNSQSTLVNAMDESETPWPGFVFRVRSVEYGTYDLSANVNSEVMRELHIGTLSTTKKIKILKINNILYYSLDDSEFAQVVDFSDFDSYFDYPVTFGSSLNQFKAPKRFFKGVLSNMMVSFLDNNATLDDYDEHILVGTNPYLHAVWEWNNYRYNDEVQNITIHGGEMHDDYITLNGTSSDWIYVGAMNDKKEVSIQTTIKIDESDLAANSQFTIVGNYEQAGFGLEFYNGILRFFGKTSASSSWVDLASNEVFDTTSIYDITFTYDGTKAKLYINGVLDSQMNLTGSITNPTNNTVVVIGANPSGSSADCSYFKGNIYSVRIYDYAIDELKINNNIKKDGFLAKYNL